MTTNCNPQTGIRYSVFALNHLNPDVADELWYGPQAKNLTEIEVEKEVRAEAESESEAVVEEVMFGIAETDYANLNNEAFVEARIDAAFERLGYDSKEDYIEYRVEREMENAHIDEPTIEGEYEGVQYHISWLGGAPLLWVFQSPLIGRFNLCSPCVPNACDLSSPNPLGYEGYTIPSDWLQEGESNGEVP